MEETVTDKSRQYLLVISVAFSSFMARLNNYTVNVSLPAIAEDLHIGTGEASRIIMSYLLIITSSLLLFGKLSDRMGLKKIFLTGYIIFVAGSLLCGISQTIDILIGSRFIQGIGGAMLLATSFAIIAKYLPQGRRGWAFGITSTASALGVATGAPIGGLVTGYLSWHWVFLMNVPVGIVAMFVAGRGIPGKKAMVGASDKKQEGFDLLGAVLSFSALSVLLYALNTGRKLGWASPAIVSCFAISALLLFGFIMWEKRNRAPLLDLDLFRNLTFSLALSATFMSFMLIAGNAFLLPFYLQIIKGLNPQETGMVLLVYSLIYVFISPYAGRLSDKVSPNILCMIAMLSAAINTFIFSYTLRLPGLSPVFVFLVWLGFSYVFFFSPNNNQVMGQAPSGRQGTASGLFNTTTNLGMVFGVALFETVFSQIVPALPSTQTSLLGAGIPTRVLLDGFRAAYLLGGVLCVAALIFSLMVRRYTARE